MPGPPRAWEPLTVDGVADLLGDLRAPWWVAGGWALDLHLGRQTRAHADTDVLVLRRDLRRVREHLREWDLHAALPPGVLRPWRVGDALPRAVHDVWCRPVPAAPWALQLMVDDCVDDDGDAEDDRHPDASHPDDGGGLGGTWVYRRDRRVRRPVALLAGPASDARRRVLAPEVQLLAKSQRPRPKDVDDFRTVVGALGDDQRAWLRAALLLTAPGHAWLDAL